MSALTSLLLEKLLHFLADICKGAMDGAGSIWDLEEHTKVRGNGDGVAFFFCVTQRLIERIFVDKLFRT